MIWTHECGWSGIPTFEGGVLVRPVGPVVQTPGGRWEQRPGRREGSKPVMACVGCGVEFGRNDPCPCGSGRKVKRCCGA